MPIAITDAMTTLADSENRFNLTRMEDKAFTTHRFESGQRNPYS
ncbi:hypothetical protein [Kovacikia minuta]